MTNIAFYIGQLYSLDRDEIANVTSNDPVATVLTTEGYLSNGNSFSLTVNGGYGNDFFDVLSNRFVLDLNGDSDDDLFVVRSFLMMDLHVSSVNSLNDLPYYVVNSLVDIDGGNNNDELIVVGTEADDRYVISSESVHGSGLTLSLSNIETVIVTVEAGDDTLSVLSTSPDFVV